MSQVAQKVGISERALVARIERALAKRGETLRRCREDSKAFASCGRYYVVDVKLNGIVSSDVYLEEFARELGVLRPYETILPEALSQNN